MPNPQIISIVSGKGGVGKTMLSVAIANELSRSKRTLLIDLDFFNRGLTGLFASLKHGSHQTEIAPPKFLESDNGDKWSVSEVSKNLLMVYYGDFDKSQCDLLEMKDIKSLSMELLSYVQYLAQVCNCDFVVLDCHGGPDNTSFAACLIATRAVLVSEPDRITLHGTLNFLRTMRREAPSGAVDVRLIFNKVVPAFTSLFLFSFYDKFLRSEFGERDLLAIYPLEVYLTKAFEKMPFLTTAYPQSQLASKTRLVLCELFASDADVALPPQIANLGPITVFLSKYYMGRWPGILNLDFSLKAIAIYAIVVFGIPGFLSYRGFDLPKLQPVLDVLQIGMIFAFPWVLAVIVLNWTRELDIFLTYSFRTHAVLRAAIAGVTLTAIWAGPAILFGGAIHEAFAPASESLWWYVGLAVAVSAAPALCLMQYARRGIRNIKYDGRYLEGGFRIAFSSGALFLVVLGAAVGL
jgi:cellulose biosynthesis protein BcsQ